MKRIKNESNPDQKFENFDLFGDENEIGVLETELLKNWDRKIRKALPPNTFVQQEVKAIKPTLLQPCEII